MVEFPHIFLHQYRFIKDLSQLIAFNGEMILLYPYVLILDNQMY